MVEIRKARLAAGAFGVCLALLLGNPIVQAGWEPDPAFGLSRAAQFAVLSLGKPSAATDGQSKLDLSAVTIYGDVGVGPYGTLDFQGPSTIDGDLYLDQTLLPQDIISDAGEVTGTRLDDQDLSGAVADAIATAQAKAALAPTQVFGQLLTSTSISGNGGLNVISVDGVDYSGSNATTPLTLQLLGGDDDLFVLNVLGKFVLGPSASIRAPDPSRLLINVASGKVPVQFAANSYVGGTLLATSRKMGPLQGASGPVIGALVAEISLVGGAVINPPPIKPLAVIIAEQDAVVGIPSQLDGSDSSASFGAPLNYAWTLLEVPSGSDAQLSDPTSVDPYFVPDLAGDYLVQLVVDDGTLTSEPAVANITAQEPSAGADNVGVRRNHLFYLDLNGNDAWDIGVDGVFPFGVSTDLPLIGDWNGDGIDDIGVRRNNLFFLDLNGNRVWDPGVDGVFAFGLSTDLPVIGDWNADGIDDFGIRRDHLFYLDLNGNDVWDIGVDGVFPFGISTDLPVIGDWNGDGVDDIGVRRNNLFFLDLNGNRVWDPGVDGVFGFGLSTDLPVIGDWNADGIDDFGIRRDHLFFLDLNGNNAWDVGVDGVFPFGVSGDKPIAGKW